MSDWKAKRFWKEVTVAPCEGGFEILLDGRKVKTPLKQGLVVPTEALAKKIAQEWDAQTSQIDPNVMPFTRSANAAIDKVSKQHHEVAEMLVAYGDSDLLCYRANAPEELVARQTEKWDPLLDWAAEEMGARLIPRQGVMHQPQAKEALGILSTHVHQMDNFALTAFHDLVGISGSLVLGLAVCKRAIDAEEAWALSRVDENWQIEQWGHDEEADAQAETKRLAFVHASDLFHICSLDC